MARILLSETRLMKLNFLRPPDAGFGAVAAAILVVSFTSIA